MKGAAPLLSLLAVASSSLVAQPARADLRTAANVASIRDDEPVLTLRPTSGDSDLALSPRASLQMRAMLPFDGGPHAFDVGDLARTSAFTLRRVRVGLDATLLPTIEAHVSTDLVDEVTPAATQTPLVVAFANVDLRLTQLAAGFMRVPFTRHGLVDETRQLFMESPTGWRADRFGLGRGEVPSMLPDRRVGVQLHEEIDGFAFALGAFSGGGEGATERASSAVVAGRVEVGPWGAVPLEGAYFAGDYEYDSARASLSLGGLGRTGPNGSTRAASAALAMSYRGAFASFEAVVGRGRVPGSEADIDQRALVLDLAYRFPALAQGLELGVRADAWRIDRPAGLAAPPGGVDVRDGGDVRSIAAVANVYIWRHRVKASTLIRAARAGDPLGTARARSEGLLELTFGF